MRPSRYDVWRYAEQYQPRVEPSRWLSLGEGWTPLVELPDLAARLGLERLLLKREDLSPTGSHKARGLAFQVSALRAARPDLRWLVISSSGNAAIAAAAYGRLAGLRVAAFVSPRTPEGKLARLLRAGATVLTSPTALSDAVALASARDLPNLRPSTDPLAVEGFQSIGWELAETAPEVDGLFTFASSATSLVAIGRALERSEAVTGRRWRAALQVVQGAGACPVAGEYDVRPRQEGRSRVGDLGARKTRRVGEAKRLVQRSGGSGWVIHDEEADAATELLADCGIETSLEGAAALAAAGRAARETGLRRAIVLLTGQRPARQADFEIEGRAGIHRVSGAEEAGAVLDALEERPAGELEV